MAEHSNRRVLDYASPEQTRSNRDLVLAGIVCVLDGVTQFLFYAGRVHNVSALFQSDLVLFGLPFAAVFVINLAILRRRGLLVAFAIALVLAVVGFGLGMFPGLNIYGS